MSVAEAGWSPRRLHPVELYPPRPLPLLELRREMCWVSRGFARLWIVPRPSAHSSFVQQMDRVARQGHGGRAGRGGGFSCVMLKAKPFRGLLSKGQAPFQGSQRKRTERSELSSFRRVCVQPSLCSFQGGGLSYSWRWGGGVDSGRGKISAVREVKF